MARRRERFEPRCSLCHEMMNDASDLLWMWKRGDHEPIHICYRRLCRDKAAETGYAASHVHGADPAPEP